MDIMKKVRKILQERIPRKLKIDRRIIPTAKDVFLEDFEIKDNFIRHYLTYILLIMNNECYIDLVTEKVPVSILKLQRVINARLQLLDSSTELVQMAILYANFAYVLSSSDKFRLALSFSTKALQILEGFNLDQQGINQHRVLFIMQNMQLFLT